MKASTLATDVKNMKRPNTAWPKCIKEEVMFEASVLAARNAEQLLLKTYEEAKDYLSDIRHKVSWEYVRQAAATALAKNRTAPVNNIIALAGRFDLPLITNLKELGRDPKEVAAWVSDVANSVPNVYWGNAKVNRGIGADIDLHFYNDFLGEAYHRPQDPQKSPMSDELSDVVDDMSDYLNGKKGLTSKQLLGLWNAVRCHYFELNKLAKTHNNLEAVSHFSAQYDACKFIGQGWLDIKGKFVDIVANT